MVNETINFSVLLVEVILVAAEVERFWGMRQG